MNIQLHIERLILDGLNIEPGQGAQVKAAVEAELIRLLSSNGLAPDYLTGRVVPSVRATGIHLECDSHPAQVGRQIAQAVYGGIGK